MGYSMSMKPFSGEIASASLGRETRMIELRFRTYRRARIWIDETPLQFMTPSLVTQHTVLVTQEGGAECSRVTIEVSVPTGARILNGLLGAVFTPSHGNSLHIQYKCMWDQTTRLVLTGL